MERNMDASDNFLSSQSARDNKADELKEDLKAFCLVLHLSQFKPSDISVSISERVCIIEASHEEYCDEHGFVARDFMRKEALPIGVDVDCLVSHFTREGLLVIRELFDGFNGSFLDAKELSNQPVSQNYLNSEIVNKIAIVDNTERLADRRLSIQQDDGNGSILTILSSQNVKENDEISLTNEFFGKDNLNLEEYSQLDDMAHVEVDLECNKTKVTEVKESTEYLKDNESQVEYEIFYVGAAKSNPNLKSELNSLRSGDTDNGELVCAETCSKQDEKVKPCGRKNEVLTESEDNSTKVNEMYENDKVCRFGHATFIMKADVCDNEANIARKVQNEHVMLEQRIEQKQNNVSENNHEGDFKNVDKDPQSIVADKKQCSVAELEEQEKPQNNAVVYLTEQDNGRDTEDVENDLLILVQGKRDIEEVARCLMKVESGEDVYNDKQAIANLKGCNGNVDDDKDVLGNTNENTRNNHNMKERNDNGKLTIDEQSNVKQGQNKSIRRQIRLEKMDEKQQVNVDYGDQAELKEDGKKEVNHSKSVIIEINIDQEATENVIIDVTQNSATDKDDQSGNYEVHIDVENKGKKIARRPPKLQKAISLETDNVKVKEKFNATVPTQNSLQRETVKGKVRKVTTQKESGESEKEEKFGEQHTMEAKRTLRPSSKQENIRKAKNVTKNESITKKETVLIKNTSRAGKREPAANKKASSANKTETVAIEKKRTSRKETSLKNNLASDEKELNSNAKEDPSTIVKATTSKKEVPSSKKGTVPPNKKEVVSKKKEMLPIKKGTILNKK